jgi:hypothetical protein
MKIIAVFRDIRGTALGYGDFEAEFGHATEQQMMKRAQDYLLDNAPPDQIAEVKTISIYSLVCTRSAR